MVNEQTVVQRIVTFCLWHRKSKWSLATYQGTHSEVGPTQVSKSLGTTESGDTLAAEVNNVVLGGQGLTGSENL
jgi:hypothetical protein